jgi:hypothetical protein
MFLTMLKDDFPEVRLHIISELELVHKGKSGMFCQEAALLDWLRGWATRRSPPPLTP